MKTSSTHAKKVAVVIGCFAALLASAALAQESQPFDSAQGPPTSQPTSQPLPIERPTDGMSATLPTSAPMPDPWSGPTVTPPKTVSEVRSPRAAHMVAWLSFAGGLTLSLVGGSSYLGVQPGETHAPAIAVLGLGGALSVVGPSLGHLYAGEVKYATRQAGLAALIVGGAIGGAFAAYEIASPLEDEPIRVTLALVPLTAAGIYELQYATRMAEDAPAAVKRMNAKRRREALSTAP